MKYDFDTYVERKNTASVKWDSYARDVLPMWIADTDFRSPPQVTEAIIEIAKRGVYGYPLADGKFESACANWQMRRFGWDTDASQITWCPSLGVAIALCIRKFTNPGDGVAMLWPIYPPFIRLCELNQRMPRGSVLKWRSGRHEIDFDDLDAVLARPDTRLFLLCNPHNPTGRVFSREELIRIGEICAAHDVTVFSDEIHGDIVYKGRHIPFPSISPQFAAISLVGVNASKTFNLADLRSAAAISLNPALLAAFQSESDSLKLGRCSLGVAGVTAAWNECADYADQLVSYLDANMKHAVKRINSECPGLQAYEPEGTYLLWIDCKGINLEPEALGRFFLEDAKVALNNGADFGPGGSGFMRLNFACPRSLLDDGLDRIGNALKKRGKHERA